MVLRILRAQIVTVEKPLDGATTKNPTSTRATNPLLPHENLSIHHEQAHEKGWRYWQIRRAVRRFAEEAGQEDGDHAALALRVHLLREEYRQERVCWYMEMPGMQKDHGGRSMDRQYNGGSYSQVYDSAVEGSRRSCLLESRIQYLHARLTYSIIRSPIALSTTNLCFLV